MIVVAVDLVILAWLHDTFFDTSFALLGESPQQRALLLAGQADVALMHLPLDPLQGSTPKTPVPRVGPPSYPERTRWPTASASAWQKLRLCPTCRSRAGPTRRLYPDGSGAQIRNLTQLLQLIGLGRSTAIVPESTCTDLRGDLAAVPVVDAPVVTTVIAWPPNGRSRALADLIRLASAF